jgi:hypothetical protein
MVVDNQLCYGESYGKHKKFSQVYKGISYILYSINLKEKRNDTSSLSFHDHFKKSMSEASGKEEWKYVEPSLRLLLQAITISPDLTDEQKYELTKDYVDKVRKKFTETHIDLEEPKIQQIHKSSTNLVKSYLRLR